MQNQLPAGLLDQNIEFFACPDLNAYCIDSGKVVPFDGFGEPVLRLIEQDMALYPVKVHELKTMGITGRMDSIKQYLVCNYGGFDNTPDIKDGQLHHTEFWPCPKRGNCPHEGKLCDSLKTDTGEYLTRREIDVLKLIANGSMDKEIAEQLGLSLTTVTTHNRNIRNKIGANVRKTDLTRFAIQKNLI